jgi:hypothetical protein
LSASISDHSRRVHEVEGLDNAINAMQLLFSGQNHGKVTLKLADFDPTLKQATISGKL